MTTTSADSSQAGEKDGPFEDMTGKAEVTIEIRDNVFSPRFIKVTAGTKITWSNKGRVEHNVTPAKEPIFPKTAIVPDQSFSFVLDSPGPFRYFCSIHGTPRHGQYGEIQVVPAG